jgi:hypothetical protein
VFTIQSDGDFFINKSVPSSGDASYNFFEWEHGGLMMPKTGYDHYFLSGLYYDGSFKAKTTDQAWSLSAHGSGHFFYVGDAETADTAVTVVQTLKMVWNEGASVAETTIGNTGTRISLYGVTPVARATTGIAEAAFVVGTGTAVNDNSTFGGYTLQQITQALISLGALT